MSSQSSSASGHSYSGAAASSWGESDQHSAASVLLRFGGHQSAAADSVCASAPFGSSEPLSTFRRTVAGIDRLDSPSGSGRGEVPGGRKVVQGKQGVFWILTVPESNQSAVRIIRSWEDDGCRARNGVRWAKGQHEMGGATGYRHIQLCVAWESKQSLRQVQKVLGRGIHAEVTRSAAAEEYCWKEETRIPGT